MKAIDVYKTRIMGLIDEAKMNGLKIETYEIATEGCKKPIECGISISNGKDRVKVPTYKDDTIGALE